MSLFRMVIVIHVLSFTNTQIQNDTGLKKYDFRGNENTLFEAQMENSSIAKQSYFTHIASTICLLVPSACSVLENFFPIDTPEARGPRDLLAIISTMLATLLGAILVKLGVLIVLSMISIGIGKLLLIVLTLKTHLSSYKVQPQPIIYEKIYYPHGNIHRNWRPQEGQYYTDEYSQYEQ